MKRLPLLSWIASHKAATVVLLAVAALVFFGWLLRKGRSSPAPEEFAAAVAAHRSAQTSLEHAQLAEAQRQGRRAIQILNELAARSSDSSVRFEQAAALETVALIQLAADQPDQADAFFRRAIAEWARMLGYDQTAADVRWRLARCLARHASILSDADRWEEAATALERGARACRTQVPGAPADERAFRELAKIENQRGLLFLRTGRWTPALQSFQTAASIQDGLIQESSSSAEDLEVLISILANRARAHSATGDPCAALQTLAQAHRLGERLISEHPKIARCHDLLATVLEREAREIGRESQSAARAAELLERAVAIRQSLFAGSPVDTAFREKLAASYDALAESYRTGRSFAKALEYDRKALACQSQLHEEHPGVLAFRFGRGRSLHNLAELLRESGQSAEALELAREAAPLLAGVHRENVLDEDHRRAASYACWTLCTLELDRKDHRSAAESITLYQSIEPLGFEEPHESAGFLCQCIRLARDDQKLSPAEQEKLARSYADRAITALGEAVRFGFRDLNELVHSRVYEPLRDRADFARVLQKVRAFDQARKEG